MVDLKRRCAENPNASVHGRYAKKLARILSTSVEYILNGEGPDFVAYIEDPNDPYLERQIAIAAARRLGISDEAVSAVLAYEPGPHRFLDSWDWLSILNAHRETPARGNVE
jgi:hypothetical protein